MTRRRRLPLDVGDVVMTATGPKRIAELKMYAALTEERLAVPYKQPLLVTGLLDDAGRLRRPRFG